MAQSYPKTGKLLLLTLLLILPLLTSNQYILHILITVGLYAVLALSLNLVTGYTGQFSLGHAAFYGIGAYITALAMLKLGLSFWLALLLSAVLTTVFGLILGLPALRLQGDYLGIVTLGFGEIVRLIFVNWVSVTRGPMGLPGVPAPMIGSFAFDSKLSYYYLVLALVLFAIVTIHRITSGRFGLQMITIREDETAAAALGIYPTRIKLTAFSLGAFYAGMTGSVYACYISFVSPDSFMFIDSVTILAMIVLGGLSSIPGSIIGAALLVIAPEMLRFMSEYRMVLYGAMMIAVMIFKPEGFWGGSHRTTNSWRQNAGEIK
jgi:branched-chain amino acid transport system permease protein